VPRVLPNKKKSSVGGIKFESTEAIKIAETV
jgi:hypothetical protein